MHSAQRQKMSHGAHTDPSSAGNGSAPLAPSLLFGGKTAQQWHDAWMLEYNGRLQDHSEAADMRPKTAVEAATIMGVLLAKRGIIPKEKIEQLDEDVLRRIMMVAEDWLAWYSPNS
jgi:hypothetical protein